MIISGYQVYRRHRHRSVDRTAKLEWAGFPFTGWWDEDLPNGTGWILFLKRCATVKVDYQ